ncbi:HEPN domain-containing protein [Priestia megaterium]|uniref:ApeA N-terminal domain 1-containing protein n=1 Tax=Priestia megaterium TaxID=1404 RepID=UPI003CC51DE3
MGSTKALTKTMFEDFQVKGYWWIPEKEEKVSGILFYKQDKIELELLGTLNVDDGVLANPMNHQAILGMSDKGEKFTLFKGFPIQITTNFPGYPTETYSIDSFLVGGHFYNLEDINFSYCSFIPTYLTKWLSRGVFEETGWFKDDTSILEKMQLSYTPPTTFKYYVSSINAYIEEQGSANFSGDLIEERIWKNKGILYIRPEHIQSMQWLKERTYLLRELLALLTGQAIYFKNIYYFGEEEQREEDSKPFNPQYSYFFKQDKSKFKPNFKDSDILVKFSDIEENFGSILESWFGKQEILETVCSLYFNELYMEKTLLNTSFLNMVQMLEIYHRRVYEGKIFDEATYKENESKLLGYVQSELPEEFAKRVANLLSHGNEYSLSKRLREIISSLEPETKAYLFGNSKNRDRFVQQLVDTRNFLTHYDKTEKKNLLEKSDEKFYALQRLRTLVTLILFKEIGVEESSIRDKIAQSRKYQSVISGAKAVLNK